MKKIAIVVVAFIGILISIPISFQLTYQSKTSDTISTKVQSGSISGKNKPVNGTEDVEQIVTVFRESKNEYQEIAPTCNSNHSMCFR